jgi:PAS domain S-box-containing protein
MRPFEPEQAAQLTVSDRSADPLREALDRNRELLAIVGSLPGAAYRYVRRADGTDALPFISERAMAVLGVSADELRHNPKLLLDGFSAEARTRLEAAMRQPPARLMPIDVEVETTPRASPPRWVRFVARPSVLGNGDVAWDGVILDADDDVRTRLSHELFATAVEHAADGIEITDAQFRLQYVNPAFERITGYSYQEVIGKTPGSLVRSGHFDAAYYEAIERAIKAGKIWRGEMITRRKDGDLRYQEATISPVVDASGEILHFIAVKRDITEQKQRETIVIEAKDAAEQANRAKTTFLANMSHELRTPLNAIIGFAELIAMQVGGPIGSERYLGYARDIGASGEHLLKIINDVLDLTRIEAGGMELHEEPIRCADLFESSLRFIRDQAARAGLAIAVDCAADLPRLCGDQRKLRQVLINLLSNAVKFTQRGGRVRVAAARASGGGLLLLVSDTGIGMATADVARALTPFKLVDSSLARKHQGAGLGLPLAKNLVELHGGTLEVASALGQGTVVTCSFPAVRTIADESPSEAAR